MDAKTKVYGNSLKAFCLLLFLAACSLSACADNVNDTENEPITVVDSANKTITLEKAPERIVTVGKYTEFFALGLGDKIVGWYPDTWTLYRLDMWEKFDEESGVDLDAIPNIGNPWKKTMNVEQIATLEPDIFFTFDSGPYDTYHEQLENLGIPVVYLDFMTESNVPGSMEKLGNIMGVEERGKELADFYREQQDKVFDVLDDIDETEPRVYIESGFPSYGTYGPNFTFGGLVEQAGGDTIATGAGVTGYGTVSPEFIISQNPQVVIITGAVASSQGDAPSLGYYTEPAVTRQGIRGRINRTGWEDLDAIKNGNVYAINHELSRTIIDYVALQYMAKWFYPEEFADLDPEANFREFHERFLPVTYSGTWGIALTIHGDVNGDDVVGYTDLVAFALSYGSSDDDDKYDHDCDLNDDGRVNYNDLVIFAANYNK